MNLIRCRNANKNLTMATTVKMSQKVMILTSLFVLAANQQVRTSGVFELELDEFRQLDVGRPPDDKTNNPIRLTICLKEAFTSLLDGPCPFGNASITLNGGQVAQLLNSDEETISVSRPDRNKTITSRDGKQLINDTMTLVQNQKDDQSLAQQFNTPKHNNNLPPRVEQPQRSPLTNLVRILFTFRWTVSNTI